MQTTNAKLIDAGFTVIRSGYTKGNHPIIKKAIIADRAVKNVSWITMEKFDSKAARDRRLKELEADPKVIYDDFGSYSPYWDEERGGVVVPLLGIVLDARNIAGDETWDDARTLCAAAGQRMFTKQEAYLLMWQKEQINAILKEHHGDLLDGWFWTDTEHEKYSGYYAWYVYFGSGTFSSSNKHNTFTVRAVAAL